MKSKKNNTVRMYKSMIYIFCLIGSRESLRSGDFVKTDVDVPGSHGTSVKGKGQSVPVEGKVTTGKTVISKSTPEVSSGSGSYISTDRVTNKQPDSLVITGDDANKVAIIDEKAPDQVGSARIDTANESGNLADSSEPAKETLFDAKPDVKTEDTMND